MMNYLRLLFVSACFYSILFLTGCLDNPLDSEAGKPTISKHPKNIAANYGDSVHFTISISGDQPLSVQWFKTSQVLIGQTDTILNIYGATLKDTGVYRAVVTNSKGTITSDTVHLRVSIGEPVIGFSPISENVALGDSRSLHIQVAGTPPLTYNWYRNNILIDSLSKDSLSILNFSLADTGVYYVIVRNPAGVDTSTLFSLSCSSSKLFITETDYNSGLLEYMDIAGKTITAPPVSIFSDAAVRTFGGYVYILERFGADNIIKYDPSQSGTDGVLYQVHLGDNWNPQDIEFVSESKAYIANQNVPFITVFNPLTGKTLKNISIHEYAFKSDSTTIDSTSTPHAADLILSGKNLYVLLQRRNGWDPVNASLLLIIDTDRDSIVDTISCVYKNGYATCLVDSLLYITNPGKISFIGDGAIEVVNLNTKVVKTIIDETSLGGSPNCIVHKSGTVFYINTYKAWENVPVYEIDLSTGTILTTLPGVINAFGGITYDTIDKRLYVGECATEEVGIKIFENNVQVGTTVKSSNSLSISSMVIVR